MSTRGARVFCTPMERQWISRASDHLYHPTRARREYQGGVMPQGAARWNAPLKLQELLRMQPLPLRHFEASN